MWYKTNKNQKKWQKAFIRDIFKKKSNKEELYSQIILNNVLSLEEKEKYFRGKLCKYYLPTSDNIIDIQKRRLWLSHPSTFNDPFDCHTGYDNDEYGKQNLLDYINNHGVNPQNHQDGFTKDDLKRLSGCVFR